MLKRMKYTSLRYVSIVNYCIEWKIEPFPICWLTSTKLKIVLCIENTWIKDFRMLKTNVNTYGKRMKMQYV